MQRTRRRIWTATVTLVASLVVCAALLTVLFRLAVEVAPGQREHLADWVGQRLGQQVQIAALDLRWWHLAPSLDLSSVVLFDDEGMPAAHLTRMRLGISLPALLRGSVVPDRVAVQGLTVTASRRDGVWHVAGAAAEGAGSSGSGEALDQVLARIQRFAEVRIAQSTLLLRGQDERLVALRVHELRFEQQADGARVDAQLQLPPEYGGEVRARLRLGSALADPTRWRGSWQVVAQDLRPEAWLAPYLKAGTPVHAAGLALSVEGRLVEGRPAQAELHLSAEALAVGHGPPVGDLALHARLSRQGSVHQVDLLRLRAVGRQRWRLDAGTLAIERSDGVVTAVRLDLPEIALDIVGPWMAALQGLPPGLSDTLATLRGAARDVVVRAARVAPEGGDGLPWQLAWRAELVGAGGRGATVGVDGLHALLSGSETEWRIALRDHPLELAIPRAFERPLPLEGGGGVLTVRRLRDGWRVNGRGLSAQMAGASVHAELDLLRRGDAAPQIALEARLAAEDAARLAPWMPRRWSQGLRDWLQRAVRRARVVDGELLLRGPLDRLPLRNPADGMMRLRLDVTDAQLDYAPPWPAVVADRARLVFERGGMQVQDVTGSVAGMALQGASARIADFRAPRLSVDARVEADGERLYAVLRDTPLREHFGALTRSTRLRGQVPLSLSLDIPLREVRKLRAQGMLDLHNAELEVAGIGEPLRAINGQIRFDGARCWSEGMLAKLYGVDLVARIDPRTPRGVRIGAEFRLEHGRGSALEQAFVPQWLARRLDGETSWRAVLEVGGSEPLDLRLDSSLVGTRVDLPAGLGKAADAPLPVSVHLHGDARQRRLAVTAGQRLAAQWLLAQADGRWLERAAALAFGTAELPAPQPGVRRLEGRVDALDLEALLSLLAELPEGSAPLPTVADGLAIGEVGYLGLRGSDLDVSLRAEHASLEMDLAGSVVGRVTMRLGQDPALRARIDRARLSWQGIPPQAGERAPADPERLPALDVDVASLSLGDAELGRLAIRSTRVAQGQRLELLQLTGPLADVQASGQWWRQPSGSGAELALDAQLREVERLLDQFGFARNVEARSGRVHAELRWAPDPQGIRWEQAQGTLMLDLRDGRLRAVEPGAGRMLALVNVYALPRRLALNFRDVVGSGMVFDRLRGEFRLGGGNALTDGLTVETPSLRIVARGRIGLAQRDYDQQVTVYPDVSAGVTLASALLGGPAVGALVLLAQELLDKPLDRASQLSYRITGSWDDPRISRATP